MRNIGKSHSIRPLLSVSPGSSLLSSSQPTLSLLKLLPLLLILLVFSGLSCGCTVFGASQKANASVLRSQAPSFDDSTASSLKTRQQSDYVVNTEPERPDVVMTFVGDCTLGDVNDSSLFASTFDQQGAEYFLDGIRSVFAADDLTVVNMEGPLTDSTAKVEKGEPPVFWMRGRPEFIDILKTSSVELANFANNHLYDYGEQGVSDTKQAFAEAGIDYYGYDNVFVREINGVKIGIFGFAFDSNAGNIQQQVQALKDEGCEVIVATFHEGASDRSYEPTANQRSAAYAAIDAGADVVVQHHVHNLQGIEEYNGGVIAYSVGNFCYGGHSNPTDKDTMILSVEVTRNEDGLEVDYRIIPASISSSPDRNDYRPQILEGSEAQRVLDKIAEMSEKL